MSALSDEIYMRFPELLARASSPDRDLPYAVMAELVDWLQEQGSPDGSPELIRRVTDFHRWCIAQPSGATAADDTFTTLTVVLYEGLLEHEDTCSWVRYLVPKEHLVRNRDYFDQWVGQAAVDRAIASYDRKVRP